MANITLEKLEKLIKPKSKNRILHTSFNNIKINSREINKGDIFIALVGKNYDAHKFVSQAFENGAYLAIVEKPVDYPFILVDDTYEALKKIAGYIYERSHVKSIAVLGSSGKTTTKELICSILRDRHCHKTEENENNFIGVSKTLLSAGNSKVYIVEIGTNHKGEIADIRNFFKPDITVFTNIGRSHIGNFGSTEAILQEKISIVTKETKVVYNYDDLWLRKAFKDREAIKCSIINPAADVYIHSFTDNGFIVSLFKNLININLTNKNINTYNILLSAACAYLYDSNIQENDINRAIADFKQPKLRMQSEKINSTEFILDCYNANPDSMKYALSLFAQKGKKRLAVLGDMLELGEFSEKMHKEIGEFIDSLDTDLIAFGRNAYHIYTSAKNSKHKAYFFNEKKEVVSLLKSIYEDYDTVLIKGSRGMKMEDIFYELKGDK